MRNLCIYSLYLMSFHEQKMKMILLTLGFIALVVNLIAATLKGVTWILNAIEWIGVWCTDWRDEYRKWEG